MGSKQSSKSHAGSWIAAILAAPVLYVLSTGPVWCVLARKYPWPSPHPRAVTAVYDPVWNLMDHFEEGSTVAEAFRVYMEWWIGL